MKKYLKAVIKSTWLNPAMKLLCYMLRSVGYAPRHSLKSLLSFSGSFVVNTPVGKIRLMHTGKWIENELFWRGLNGYEPGTISTFLKQATSAGVIFDVGANSGLFAIIAQKANPLAKVYAFEPSPEFYPVLEKNNKLNGGKIKTINAAVGNFTGTASLLAPPPGYGNSYASTLKPSHYTAHQNEPAEIHSVRTVTLNQFISDENLQKLDLLKIDAEGFELEILESFAKQRGNSRPAIIIEILNQQNGQILMEWFPSTEYQYFNIAEKGYQESSKVLGTGPGTNYLLLPLN